MWIFCCWNAGQGCDFSVEVRKVLRFKSFYNGWSWKLLSAIVKPSRDYTAQVKGLWLCLWELWHSAINMLITECQNSHTHSQSPLTNTAQVMYLICIRSELDLWMLLQVIFLTFSLRDSEPQSRHRLPPRHIQLCLWTWLWEDETIFSWFYRLVQHQFNRTEGVISHILRWCQGELSPWWL